MFALYNTAELFLTSCWPLMHICGSKKVCFNVQQALHFCPWWPELVCWEQAHCSSLHALSTLTKWHLQLLITVSDQEPVGRALDHVANAHEKEETNRNSQTLKSKRRKDKEQKNRKGIERDQCEAIATSGQSCGMYQIHRSLVASNLDCELIRMLDTHDSFEFVLNQFQRNHRPMQISSYSKSSSLCTFTLWVKAGPCSLIQ